MARARRLDGRVHGEGGPNIRLLLAWLKLLCALIRAAILAASQRTSITITRQAFT